MRRPLDILMGARSTTKNVGVNGHVYAQDEDPKQELDVSGQS